MKSILAVVQRGPGQGPKSGHTGSGWPRVVWQQVAEKTGEARWVGGGGVQQGENRWAWGLLEKVGEM